MRRPERNTTQLPKQLIDELGLNHGQRRSILKPGGRPSSRKERRKAERSKKKRHQSQGSRSRQSNYEAESGSSEEELLSDSDDATPSQPARPAKPQALKRKAQLEPDHSEESDPSLAPKPARPISRAVRDKLAEDDAEISRLEKALGMKGKKSLPKSFHDDGLDELLGDLAGSDSGLDSKKRSREAEEWLQNKRRKAVQSQVSRREVSDSGSDNEDINLDEDDELLGESDSEASDSENDEDGLDQSEFEGLEDVPKPTRENPYLPPTTTKSDQKYIPPSLRAAPATESEALTRLRRQMQGYLNKLSEANIISILSEIEKLYQTNPRQNVTSTLIDLLLSLIGDRSVLNDTFIILHAAFIAAVYKVIGMDFGAELVQHVVEKFDGLYQDQAQEDHHSSGKTLPNLLSLLSHLYNFQVIGSSLVFDYIRLLLQEINEQNTELLLKIIKTSGTQLRQDDPSSLKDIVMLIQPAIAQVGEAALSVRTKFMIEIITDLKNNRLKTGAAGAAISFESTTRMKKVLGSLNSRNIRASEPLRISRVDIHDSSKKGKWWLVGASWKDTSMVHDQMPGTNNGMSVLPDNLDDDLVTGELDLAQLAKAHRMNTDVRRSIFVAIMSATDCRDAHMRLMKLRLKRNQETEIAHVLIHCATEEEVHNPYYTLIARKLCGERKIKMSFMFSLWDIFKRLGEKSSLDDDNSDEDSGHPDAQDENKFSNRAIVNLAKLYGTLIADGMLSLGVLKPLDFPYLQTKTKTLVELLLITVISRSQRKPPGSKGKKSKSTESEFDEKSLIDIFIKTKETPQVVAGLRYFVRKVLAKTDMASSKTEKNLIRLGCKVASETLGLVSGGGGRHTM
ncbi:suppressor of glycerol defect [Myotisia sp. PD_48]|nr:suppressor of glycerol defect [Myotisia sp. PD_48]